LRRASFFERRGHFSTVQICRHNIILKPASRSFYKVFAQKPVQITICIEHRTISSNHLAENLQIIRKAAANFLLCEKMDCLRDAASAFLKERKPLETANYSAATICFKDRS
jgi:hypothetical protein